jgi:lipopolysaccharide export system protein LptA
MAQNKIYPIAFFFLFCCLIIFKATLQKRNPSLIFENSGKILKSPFSRYGELVMPQIFHLKEGAPSFFISSELARVNLVTDDAELNKPKGKSFNLERGPINYSAETGYYYKKKSEMRLNGSVLIEERDSSLRANQVIYKMNKDEIFGEGDVLLNGILPKTKDRIQITASKFNHFPKRKITSFKENIVGFIQRREAYREGINFQTDLLDYFFQDQRINLIGNVLFKRKPFSASSRNGQIYLNTQNKLNYFVLNDDVKLVEKIVGKGKEFERKAFAEKMEGFPDEGKLILTGYPRVFQENEIIKGIRIIVRENSNVVEVEEANTTLKIQKDSDGKNFPDSE